ncbi:MAG: peptidoglycan-associated lipoprotein [Deltaproteobacteria bacterium]|nr:peptidoglycan-associated lipoprotein [Deltaproteobacteria bacterium]
MQLFPILFVTLLALAMGCAGTTEPVEDTSSSTVSDEFDQGAAPAPPQNVADQNAASRDFTIAPIYFDFNRSEIRSEFKSVLTGASTALTDSGATVVIEGHCDERGSEEYNIALGERRATSVRKYLYNLGVPMGQMSVVSYGEARPAVSGSGESAWQLNRRAQFTVR